MPTSIEDYYYPAMIITFTGPGIRYGLATSRGHEAFAFNVPSYIPDELYPKQSAGLPFEVYDPSRNDYGGAMIYVALSWQLPIFLGSMAALEAIHKNFPTCVIHVTTDAQFARLLPSYAQYVAHRQANYYRDFVLTESAIPNLTNTVATISTSYERLVLGHLQMIDIAKNPNPKSPIRKLKEPKKLIAFLEDAGNLLNHDTDLGKVATEIISQTTDSDSEIKYLLFPEAFSSFDDTIAQLSDYKAIIVLQPHPLVQLAAYLGVKIITARSTNMSDDKIVQYSTHDNIIFCSAYGANTPAEYAERLIDTAKIAIGATNAPPEELELPQYAKPASETPRPSDMIPMETTASGEATSEWDRPLNSNLPREALKQQRRTRGQ